MKFLHYSLEDLNFEKAQNIDLFAICVDRLENIQTILGKEIIDKVISEGFGSKIGELFFTYNFSNNTKLPAIVLVGLNDANNSNCDNVRKASANVYHFANTKRFAKVGLLILSENWIKSAIEGICLASYKFDKYISKNERKHTEQFALFSNQNDAKTCIEQGVIIANSVCFGRDLINESPSILNPIELSIIAKKEATFTGLDISILDEKKLKKERFGLLLAVGSGALDSAPARVIRIAYNPLKKSKMNIVLVGKGVTFDSGGLNMKSSDNMLHMKTDMSGAACVLAVMRAIAQLKPQISVSGYLACVENAVDSKSYHPGDILISRKKISVEINNTDAEGRLILADTLNYAQEIDTPDVIIDVATLTGACVIALGQNMAGLFSNSDYLSEKILQKSNDIGENYWRLPLNEDLFEQLKTPLADLKNTGERWGGAITAALFLQKFIEPNVLWAHLDIAGPARNEREHPYVNVGGTAFGVRTLIELIQTWPQEHIFNERS